MKHEDIDHTGLTGIGDLSAHTGDTSDAHDASAISVLDTAGNFTATDVEATLAELQDNIDAVSGAFDDDWLPWHIYIPAGMITPDATAGTGTWVFAGQGASTDSPLVYPYYSIGSTANSGLPVAWVNSSPAQNDAFSLNIALAAGTWDCNVFVRKASDKGIITLLMDGASQGTADTYAASGAAAKVTVSGFTVASTGKKVMQFKAATKNGSSSGYQLSIFGIHFRRTA